MIRTAAQWSRQTAASAPLTVTVLVMLLGLGAVTGSILAGPPQGLQDIAGVSASGLRSGNWWSMFTSLFFATNPLAYAAASVMLLFLLGPAERKLGTPAAAVLFFGGQFAAVTLFLLLTQVAGHAGDSWLGNMADGTLIGPYAPVLTAGLAASARLPVLWQRRLRAAVLAGSLLLVLYVGHPETVVGLMGALLGLAAGWWIQSGDGQPRRHHSTGRETRNLLALTVAVFAVGPILTGVARAPRGPLALLRDIVLSPVPTLGQLAAGCGTAEGTACLERGTAGFGDPLGLALSVVPVALLLICADAMRRGRRLALNIVLAVQLSVAALAVVYLAMFADVPAPAGVRGGPPGTAAVHLLPVALAPLLLAGVLWLNRRHFRVGTPPAVRRKLGAATGGTWLLLAGSYTAAWSAPGGRQRDQSVSGLFAELARQYLPVPLPQHYQDVFAGRSGAEAVLFAAAGPVFWCVALVAVWLALRGSHRSQDAGQEERAKARRLLRQGGGPLSWMALWEPNSYWFSPGENGAVAFQQHGSVALTLGDPFGPSGHRQRSLEGFLAYCREHALVPALYSCGEEIWPALSGRGFARVEVAQETRLDIRNLEFKGKEWQNVRTAQNRAAKLGIRSVWAPYRELPPGLRARLDEVSEEWAAGKKVPEMGFTLGGVDELDDPEILCCLAVDPDGAVHGVTSWLPVYDGGRLVSRTLDVMRRGAGAFPGVMEFLIACAVVELRGSVDTISLSGSPLARRPEGAAGMHGLAAVEGAPAATQRTARTDGGTGSGVADSGGASGNGAEEGSGDGGQENLVRILDVVGKALEPVYGFRSLAAFKSRFKPEYRSLYLYYQDPLHLPAIGRALTRAYLPGLSFGQGARLLRTLVR
ncbi:bifunctional lysylphosphatidylglycerol flippase/synthetase MprF [Pseudarthrobacter sp. NPDC092439]|uniref:bifunctional lysylphosphatidylglycerol flippase/synthetase MprF n=1 Tax=unclassified Pseudarthrobacter TaxID=2647000 RepID=UPI003805523F